METGAVLFAMAMLGSQPDEIPILDEQKGKDKDKGKDNLDSAAVFVSGAAPILTAAETEEKPFNGDISIVRCLDCRQPMRIEDLNKGCPCNQWSKCPDPECEKVFKSRKYRIIHVRDAHGGRAHVCTWHGCEYRSSTPSNLKIHIRTHTGEKPYGCTWDGCDYRSSTPSTLKRHLITHTGVKSTRICGKKKKENNKLQRIT